MKKIIYAVIPLLLIGLLFAGCKKQPVQKNKVQQTIQTPVMQMAEPPQQVAPAKAATETQPQAAADQTTAAQPAPAANPAAATPAAPSAPSTQTLVKAQTNIDIIVDASGSMNGLLGKTTKVDALKTALKNVLATPLPPEMNTRKIALRVFGSKSPVAKNDCNDTDLLLKMDRYDAATSVPALDKITPQGVTPLAFTLEESNKDFVQNSDGADNLIVLITDGIESCNGDPIAAVERLHKGPAKVMVDVIGFDVDQPSQEALKKMAAAGSGQFFLARSDVELANALDQAVNSSLPYNLRVKVLSGASPIPSFITVYRANTQQVVERSEASGIKFFKLPPGSYDVLVEFKGSIEATKPSKMVKGVEVTATSKAEQAVTFDLGNVSLTALDQDGKPTTANFYLRKAGADDIIGRLMAAGSPQMIPLTPGTYDLDAETTETGGPTLTAQLKGIEVKVGETTEQTIRFQTGKLSLKAQNVLKQPIPFTYKIAKPGTTEAIATGEGTLEGTTLELPPGKYDVIVVWTDPKVQGSPEAKVKDVTVAGGETNEQVVTIVTGTLKLSGKDSQKKFVHTEFEISKQDSEGEAVKAVSEEEPVEVFVEPGTYDITATNTTSKVVPAPSVEWNDVTVKEGGSEAFEAVFKLGGIKLIGKNAKEQIIPATFTVYRSGTDEELATENSEKEWVIFQLTPGLYDIRAEESRAKSEPKPTIWFHDVEIKEGASITNEAIFTSGKLKLICRGKNNVVLTCEFNVFTYGSDTALFSGTTTDEWREFDIPPGKYYMETGWHDPEEQQLLKKWINLDIDENQIVEEILRF